MATEMTHDEFVNAQGSAMEVDTFDFRSDDDADDYISARLLRTSEGRYFRVIDASGMNSAYVGSFDFGEWLTEDEMPDWSSF